MQKTAMKIRRKGTSSTSLNVALAGEEANHVVEDVSSRPEDVAQSTAIDVSQVAIGAIPSKEAQDDGVRPEGTSIKGLGQISAVRSALIVPGLARVFGCHLRLSLLSVFSFFLSFFLSLFLSFFLSFFLSL